MSNQLLHKLSKLTVDKYPDITLRKNTFLEQALTGYKAMASTECLIDDLDMAVTDVPVMLADYLEADMPSMEMIQSEMSQLSNVLAQAHTKALKDLRSIHAEVDQLTTKIDVNHNKLLSSNPVTMMRNNQMSCQVEFQSIPWDILDNAGRDMESCKEQCHQYAGLDNRATNHAVMCLVGTRLYAASEGSDGVVQLDQVIPEATLKNIAKSSLQMLRENMSLEDAKKALRFIMSTNAFDRFRNRVTHMLSSQMKPSVAVIELLDHIRILAPATSTLLQVTNQHQLAEEHTDKFLERVEIINQLVDYSAYLANYYRHNILKESLVISNPAKLDGVYESFNDVLVNPDVMTSFSTEHNVEDIVRHLEMVYKGKIVPVAGIKANIIANSSETLKTNLINDTKKLDQKYKFVEKTSRRDAIMHALGTSWKLNNQEHGYLKSMVSHMISSDTPTEDILYNAIIGLRHRNTLVEQLYKKFNEMYVETLKSTSDLTDKDLQTMEMKVVTDMIAGYLVKKFAS